MIGAGAATLMMLSTVAGMQWEKRVLIVAAPDAADPKLAVQRRIIADWRTEAEDRDLTVVEVVRSIVRGTDDDADALRRQWRLPANGFQVVLIGKDGGEKLRSSAPLPAAALKATIDAMPMRKAGGR